MAKAARFDIPTSFRRTPRLLLQLILAFTALVGLSSGGLMWFLPIDVVQSWAYERAPDNDFQRFEAIGHAEFVCWLLRIVGPLLLIMALLAWRDLSRVAGFLSDAWNGLLTVTRMGADSSIGSRWRTVIVRVFLVAWSLLAIGHFADALRQRMRDWPYYRFRSGVQVLPNISDSNRDVIRYLKQATPENARILIVSDQKLFFLSYYLLPRRLYHKMHPGSEHVIPKEHLQRQLATYKLADLDQETLRRIAPDYILEYMEHPDDVDRSALQEDRNWIEFLRQSYRNPSLVPDYMVRLRRFETEGQP